MEGYKTSRYTTVHMTDYGLILFNTFSCGLIKITREEVNELDPINTEIVSFLAEKNPDYRKMLLDNGFFIKDDVDEFALVKSRLCKENIEQDLLESP